MVWKKFWIGLILFDGIGDYFFVFVDFGFELCVGVFIVEGWVYFEVFFGVGVVLFVCMLSINGI